MDAYTLSPDKRRLFMIEASTGLSVLDVQTGKILADIREGGTANASSAGVTFSADGKTALVETPYRFRLAVLDTQSLTVRQRIKLKHAAQGARFTRDGDTPVITTIPVLLPYE